MSENKRIEKDRCRTAHPKNIGGNEAAKPQQKGEKGKNAVNSPK
jgi:hypothetical protein